MYRIDQDFQYSRARTPFHQIEAATERGNNYVSARGREWLQHSSNGSGLSKTRDALPKPVAAYDAMSFSSRLKPHPLQKTAWGEPIRAAPDWTPRPHTREYVSSPSALNHSSEPEFGFTTLSRSTPMSLYRSAMIPSAADQPSLAGGWAPLAVIDPHFPLGLSVSDSPGNGKTNEGRGLMVYKVKTGSPAARAGIAPGDLITAVNGQRVRDSHFFHHQLTSIISPTLLVTIQRAHPRLNANLDFCPEITVAVERSQR